MRTGGLKKGSPSSSASSCIRKVSHSSISCSSRVVISEWTAENKNDMRMGIDRACGMERQKRGT